MVWVWVTPREICILAVAQRNLAKISIFSLSMDTVSSIQTAFEHPKFQKKLRQRCWSHRHPIKQNHELLPLSLLQFTILWLSGACRELDGAIPVAHDGHPICVSRTDQHQALEFAKTRNWDKLWEYLDAKRAQVNASYGRWPMLKQAAQSGCQTGNYQPLKTLVEMYKAKLTTRNDDGASVVAWLQANENCPNQVRRDYMLTYLREQTHPPEKQPSEHQGSSSDGHQVTESPSSPPAHDYTASSFALSPPGNKAFAKLSGHTIIERGVWSLKGRNGMYTFRNGSLLDRKNDTVAQLYVVKLPGPGYYPQRFSRPDPPFEIVDSEIMREIQKPQPGRQIFVLPSQLNSAEYPTFTSVVDRLSEYLTDRTGGPRGQLACAPAVGQFIIDNASCEGHEDGVLNNVSETIKGNDGFALKNGYLGVTRRADIADVEKFKANIHKTTLLASMNIRANGLKSDLHSFNTGPNKTVDLLYASAVPYQTYNNVNADPILNKRVCKLVLYAQYAAALCWAAERAPCELYLMLLGGGVFRNSWKWIYNEMCRAHAYAKSVSDISSVKVNILTWDGSTDPPEKITLEEIIRQQP